MATNVNLPALGESVSEGTIVAWLKKVGDSVALDEPLLEVSTDKVDTEIPSPAAGILLEITAAEEDVVKVGALLAVIGAPTDAAPTNTTPVAILPTATVPAVRDLPVPVSSPVAISVPAMQPTAAVVASPRPSRHGAGFLSPVVRAMAVEFDIDTSTLTGTGSNGRIRRLDLLAAIEAKQNARCPVTPSAGPRGRTEKLSQRRRVIADRMVASLQTSAQLTQVIEVDMTEVVHLRDKVKSDFVAREGVKLTYLPFIARATVEALLKHPKLNATIDTEQGEVTYFDEPNVAIAVDTERGLMTPVVTGARDLSIAGLAKKIADLADRARTNRITVDELSGGTFTLTNLGSFGALSDTPIINQPQVAILGPGVVVRRPVVVDSPEHGVVIAVRHIAHFALSYDHRLVDGADAGRFLTDVKTRLEGGLFDV
jgi:2-oxoglutarate dehydrogenase E2 component (dihydrolipoamide succinyltransferase)